MTILLREAIGGTIRRARTERRRTLRDVSAEARVSLGYLSEIERGRKEPSSELLAAICEALALPLPDLLDDVADALRPDGRTTPRRLAPAGVDPALRTAVEEAFGAAVPEPDATDTGDEAVPAADGEPATAATGPSDAADPTDPVGPAGPTVPHEETGDPAAGDPPTVRLVPRVALGGRLDGPGPRSDVVCSAA